MLAVSLAVLVLSYGSLLSEFVTWQLRRPHYHASIFPLIAFFALLLWRGAVAPRRVASVSVAWRTWSFLAASWLLLAAGVILPSPLMACLSAILLAGAACNELASRRDVQNLWGIWGLLWLVVPIPLGQDQALIAKLQIWSSQLCSLGLDRVGVLHLMEGNKLSLAGGELFVDEACSGIVSVLLVVSLASIYGIARNRPAAHVLLLASSGVAWATILNAIRIGSIAVALDWYGIDWSTGAAHEMVGALTALLAIGATVATDQLLLALLTPIEREFEATTARQVAAGRLLVRAWDTLVTFGPRPAASSRSLLADWPWQMRVPRRLLAGLAPFAVIGVLGWNLRASELESGAAASTTAMVERGMEIDHGTLPSEISGMSRLRYRREHREVSHMFGEFSCIYEYRAQDGTPLIVSCDFPFPAGWHELTVCYEGIGWELLSREIRHNPDQPNYVEAHFRLPDGSSATILHCAFDSVGNELEPPSWNLSETVGRAFARRSEKSGGSVFQVQVQVADAGAISEERLHSARQLMAAAAGHFRELLALPPQPATP